MTALATAVCLVFWFGGAPPARATEAPIIPLPAVVTVQAGSLTLADGALIRVPAEDPAAAEDARWLQDEVMRDRGLSLKVSADPAAAIRLVRLPSDPGLGQEGYRLIVEPRGAVIEAATDAGLFYGTVSLLQLMTPEDGRKGGVTLAAVQIEDRPRFKWRGLMLDSVRHIQSVAFIEALLDQMARYKLNTFHWHLTDDQGWRLQIKHYPRLTEVAAYRVDAGEGPAQDIDPKTGRPRLYGGFYTQDQVRTIVAYAKRRSITIVPEIEMPGHATAAIYAYPELGVQPVSSESLADWGIFPNLYDPSETTLQFLQTVLLEVMDLFPGPYIHVGGDEAVKSYWRASPKIQAQIKALGLKDEDALQSWMIQKMEVFLAAHGRRLIGWDEILDGGLADGAVVMSWRGVKGAVAAANAGHDAILTPGLPFYLDNRQSGAADEPPGRGLIIPLKTVYGFDPTPKSLDPGASAHILGLQANVWTEHIRLETALEHMAFPRAAALAEMAWSPPERRAWPSFVARLPEAIRRDQAMGLEPAQSAFNVVPESRFDAKTERVALQLSTETDLGEIHFTVDGSPPSPTSALYQAPLDLALPSHVRAQAFVGASPLGIPWETRFDAESVRHRANQELIPCTSVSTLNLEDDAPVASDHRAVFLTDIYNPCWIWRSADLTAIKGIDADVGQLPFNFELGDELKTIPLTPPTTKDGELVVHLDSCQGPFLAALPLAPATTNPAVTRLRGRMVEESGVHDLCFLFTRQALDPMWVLGGVQLRLQTP